MVHSAFIKLSVLFIDKAAPQPEVCVCEVLESSVTAVVSPVIVKLEPQTNGTLDCVEHRVAWLRGGTQQADGQVDQSPVKKAISVALDSALMISEALVDRVLPPTDEDKEEEAHWMEGFEAATLGRSFPLRLVSLSAKMLRRTYLMVGAKMQYFQLYCHGEFVFSSVSGPSDQMSDVCVEHQLLSVFVFISQMYNLSCSASQPNIKSLTRIGVFSMPLRPQLTWE